MKAKDILEKKGILFMSKDHEDRFESVMKEYAKAKCKEQREIIIKSFPSHEHPDIMKAIYEAPEPEFD